MLLDQQDQRTTKNPTQAITKHYHADEETTVQNLTIKTQLTQEATTRIEQQAYKLVEKVRNSRLKKGGLDAFMAEYDLSSEEGITLMCLAEALLRIPDKLTADKLIRDKLCSADWKSHMGESDSLFVNAATWGLMLTGKIISPPKAETKFSGTFKKLLSSRSNVFIRKATTQAMKILGKQFVMGETIESALKRAKKHEKLGYTYSYDMLGEAACTEEDAQKYLASYQAAIDKIGKAGKDKSLEKSPGISIKLSALLARYEINQYKRVQEELLPRVKQLALACKGYNIGFTIDAEEADRLELSLDLLQSLAFDADLKGWNGLGLAVQAYQKRAFYVIEWLANLARESGRRFMVRLVKGAYWDAEIKHAQIEGYAGYPVFTRKLYTDVSYRACAKELLNNTDAFYPQFATHNALSLAAILEMAGDYRDFEFQCLHGMGDTLYDQVVGKDNLDLPCRIYAPVGGHEHLLAYLVRRLLENGANTSFVNRIVDEATPISDLVKDPISQTEQLHAKPHPKIPLPINLYGSSRKNSSGINFYNQDNLMKLNSNLNSFSHIQIEAKPLTHSNYKLNTEIEVKSPADNNDIVGTVIFADNKLAKQAITDAKAAFTNWTQTPAATRAELLNKTADLIEADIDKFIAIAIREAGKTLANAINEIREAVDFCRYYAAEAIAKFSKPVELIGPTGESNQISLHGRGVVICISPWNFPLAIFLGEVTAALAAGNTVIAKPAEQTPLIAYLAVEIMHKAGIAKDVVQFLPGKGSEIGASLTSDERIAGVIFTGSTETAQVINKTLANKKGPITPLIAETGGQNCMIVDSSALPEQVINDVVTSSFDSAGQRCSALRVLFLQEDIADKTIHMLKGAMQELTVGNPAKLYTDVGPVINSAAQKQLNQHISKIKKTGKLVHQCPLPKICKNGTFVAPTVVEITNLSELKREVFGPILHIIRFKAKNLTDIVAQINATGYGLTFGVHSRIEETIRYLTTNIRAGNLYVNRNIVGAVVGIQPFGGEGLSGTGPKAGGPHYLLRLATERTISTDTTAAGGNASLMSLEN